MDLPLSSVLLAPYTTASFRFAASGSEWILSISKSFPTKPPQPGKAGRVRRAVGQRMPRKLRPASDVTRHRSDCQRLPGIAGGTGQKIPARSGISVRHRLVVALHDLCGFDVDADHLARLLLGDLVRLSGRGVHDSDGH